MGAVLGSVEQHTKHGGEGVGRRRGRVPEIHQTERHSVPGGPDAVNRSLGSRHAIPRGGLIVITRHAKSVIVARELSR